MHVSLVWVLITNQDEQQMSFSILTDTRNNITFYSLKNESNGEYAEIIPDIGATVNKLCLLINNDVNNILFCDTDDEINENPLFRGRILFPFNDVIPEGTYTFNGSIRSVDLNVPAENITIHGFVYNKKFDIINQQCTSDNCSITLKISIGKESFKGYPYEISLTLTYILSEHELKVHFHVENIGEEVAPLSFGWHPYFTFNGSLENTLLKMDSEKFAETDVIHIPTGSILDCRDSVFDFRDGKEIASLNFDNAVTAPPDGNIYLKKGTSTITIHQDVNTFKYVQLYMADDHKSIAIEPVTAAPNNFNLHDLGLITIKPKEVIETFATVRVD